MSVLGHDAYRPRSSNVCSGRQYGEARISGSSVVHQGDVNIYNTAYAPPDCSVGEQDFHLKALYYASMDDRKAHIDKDEAKEGTCDWIWSTNFAQWLASADEKLFWISGKPGSGKSTLMRFLERAEGLNARLPPGGRSWRVISFFFDFRLAEQTGNRVEGLLRSLLVYILRGRPDIAVALGIQTLGRGASSYIPVGSLEKMFSRALAMTNSRFLLLIDGLDEFNGNMQSLLQTLTALRHHETLKLCLASRPEAMIQYVLGVFPSIRMSDHNWQGIQRYIQLSIDQFRPRLDALQLQEIQDVIHKRAQGVFLWVYLAIGEVLQAWAAIATPTEVKARLNLLPTKLRDFYKRILNRLPEHRRAEAAILYTLVDKADYPVSTELLRGAFHFLAHELQLELLPPECIGLQDFELRLHATTGGLIEVSRRPINPRIRPDEPLTVRLIHETVRSFSAESLWAKESLPPVFLLRFPDHVWARLCREALLAGDRRIQAMPKHVPVSWFNRSTQQRKHNHFTDYQAFDSVLQHRLPNDSLLSWTRLLWHSISFIIYHAHEDVESSTAVTSLGTEEAMRTRWAKAQLTLCQNPDQKFGPSKEITDSDERDLFIAGMHRAHRYLRSQQRRLSSLNDTLRGGLVVCMILMSSLSSIRDVEPYISSRSDPPGFRSAVDMVLSLDDTVSTFHLATYLRLGYRNVPEYLQKHLRAGRLPRQEPVQVPCWIPAGFVFPEELPLFVWACEAFEVPEDGCTFEKQLKVLTGLGTDINAVSSKGYNIVHHLITEHIIKHTFLVATDTCLPDDDLANGIEKLYLVEKARANFGTICRGRTALQALQNGIERIHQTPEDELLFELTETAVARLAQVEFMLEHKARVGHLPHPPMGTNYRGGRNLPALKQNVEQRRCDMCTVVARRDGVNAPPSKIPRWAALLSKP